MERGGLMVFLFSFFDNLNRFDFFVLDKFNKRRFFYIFQKYLEDMKIYFGVELQFVNFLEVFGRVRKEINFWVESQIEGKFL